MNTLKHAQISQKRHGGQLDDYLAIHSLIDSTKKLCSDNRHRILHTFWGIQEVVIPLFGEYFINSNGTYLDTKDFCEKDHLLIDFQHKFIPTLADFVEVLDLTVPPDLARRIENIHSRYIGHPEISRILLSPLSTTGQLKSLLLTHNSWFINNVLVKMNFTQTQFVDFDISPAFFFNSMQFEMWMDNGFELPPSARNNQFSHHNNRRILDE